MIKGKVVGWAHGYPPWTRQSLDFNPVGVLQVMESFEIDVVIADKGQQQIKKLFLKRGFECDGASTKLRGAESTKLAAALHDFIYGGFGVPISRRQADKLFFLMLLQHHRFPMWRAIAWWLGVRVAGWQYYKKRS